MEKWFYFVTILAGIFIMVFFIPLGTVFANVAGGPHDMTKRSYYDKGKNPCQYCHIPHNAAGEKIWARGDSATLTSGPYGSIGNMCYTCHDGTVTIGAVNVLGGQGSASIDMSGTASGKMASGSGSLTGFTRDLGANLSNDHPISFSYNDSSIKKG